MRLISPGERYARYADIAHGMLVEDWLFCGVGPGGFSDVYVSVPVPREASGVGELVICSSMELFSRDGGGVEVTLEMKKRVVAGGF
jgi:hypothetical protein